jgi:hypothetical protein
MRPTRTVYFLLAVVFSVSLVFAPARAADPSVPPPGVEDPRPYLDRMALFLSDARQFQTTVRMGYEVLQASGQKIEFSERRRITIARPDRLRVEIVKSSGEKGLVLFDGRTMTAYSETDQVYAQAEKPGSLDEALAHFLQNLRMRMPLALMLSNDFAQEMQRRLQELFFVEVSALTDIPCVHLAGRTGEIDFQVWIPTTGDPLPRRLVITYRDAEGQPNFWADFSEWDMTPAIADRDFVFRPPASTERIPFLTEMESGAREENPKGGN